MRDKPDYEEWLEHGEFRTYTTHTIIDKEALRGEFLRIRQQGWAVSEQQLELGFRGVAVPLRDAKGTLVAALNVTMPMGQEKTDDAVVRVLNVLRETATSLRNLI
jgi:IclR family pca regulon transcriptional regulator